MRLEDLQVVDLGITDERWVVKRNRLCDIDPATAGSVLPRGGFTVWHACFIDDLVWIVNEIQGLLIDVGWRPDSDPQGKYVFLLLKRDSGNFSNIYDGFDWDEPIIKYETSILSDLLTKIKYYTNSVI